MKSNKTMFALAKAMAFENGILSYRDNDKEIEYFGYLLPKRAINRIYQDEGFTSVTLERHLKTWESLGKIKIVGQHVFFNLLSTDYDQVIELSLLRQDRSSQAHDSIEVFVGLDTAGASA